MAMLVFLHRLAVGAGRYRRSSQLSKFDSAASLVTQMALCENLRQA